MNINREFISTVNTYAGQNKPKYIVIHETDNFSKGAGARRHAEAQAAGHLSTSVHYYAGSDGVYQTAAHADGVWAIGKEYDADHSVTDATNRNTISVEICVNSDGDYKKARQNAIELVKYLIPKTGIPAERVIRHFDVKGKYCPRRMMDDPSLWEDFKAQIANQGAGKEPERLYVAECTGDGVRVRATPDFGDNVIRYLNKGNLFDVLGVSGAWTHIRVVDKVGYIYSDYVRRK